MCEVGEDLTDSKVHIATMTTALFIRQYWSLLSYADFVLHVHCVN